MKNSKKSSVSTPQAWLMWFLAATFFASQFILRLFPSLIMPELMTQFKIDATSFGILSAAYYLGYAGMQIPVGMMLDRFHPKYVISGCALLCSLGTLPFIYTDHWLLTLLGRFLIGAGSAAGFLGTAKTVRSFFSEKQYTNMIGLSFSFGLMGALYGGKPVSLMIESWGWNPVLKILASFSAAIAIAIFVLFPRIQDTSEPGTQKKPQLPLLASMKELMKYPQILYIGIAGAFLAGPLEGFADIWGVSYLNHVHGFSRTDASLISSSIYFGMLFGGPILSYVAQKRNAYYGVSTWCGLLMLLSFIAVIVSPYPFSQNSLIFIMSFVGILCCYQVIVFGLVSQIIPTHLIGLGTSITNCINMIAGCGLHFVMGWLMDKQWTGLMKDNVKIYENISYQTSISFIPATLFLGSLGFMFLSFQQKKQKNLNKQKI